MFDRLEEMEKNFIETQNKVNDAEVIARQNEWREYMKELNYLNPIVDTYRKWRDNNEAREENEEMLEVSDDAEMTELIEMELEENKRIDEELTDELKILLLPKDENDDKNVIVEIRGGAGGDEAALFAGDLFRMYTRYAERHNWKSEIISANENDIGGFREVSFMINGEGAYSRLKFESGVHRVQRVPETESSGRIHTSTVTVAVLPEAEEVDVEINPNDVKEDTFRSSGNGGQSVNTTDSAIRLTHEPSGIVVSCQDERSQHKNRDKAYKVLRAKIFELELEKQQSGEAAERKSQIGTGDRSERIRTYNFPQGRMTDHRVGLTMHNLEDLLDGDLDEMMDTIITTNQAELLKNMGA